MTAPRVELTGITKRYGGSWALRGVDLTARAGEIHALCGENGAGKSTLMRILGGAETSDAGTIRLDGQTVHFGDPGDALNAGVAVIHQEFSLVDSLTVAENILLGHEPRTGPWLNRRRLRREAQAHLDHLGFPIDARQPASRLATGPRQLIEIAKATSRRAGVLILDEPTAALTGAEAERLFAVLDDLKGRGLALIYISHHLDEVERIADRITVLRDGRRIGSWNAPELSRDALIHAMVGDVVDVRPDRGHRPNGLDPADAGDRPGPDDRLQIVRLVGSKLNKLDLRVRRGEVVGLTGLADAGHEELGWILSGTEPAIAGEILIDGRPYRPGHPARAKREGVAVVPADRRRDGLIGTSDVAANAVLSSLGRLARAGWLYGGARRRLARRACSDLEVTAQRLGQSVLTLSGGNQQKVLLARELATTPRLLVLQDPTRGIDVRTREAIHRKIDALAVDGLAILVMSADAPELLRVADRIIVLRDGRVVLQDDARRLDEHAILDAMTQTIVHTNDKG